MLRTIMLRTISSRVTLFAAFALLLPSCTSLSPESRLRAGLVEAGLAPEMAGCMAPRMTGRLSIMQLRKLQSLASLRKSHSPDMTVDRLLHKVRALGDPEILAVTSAAALRCAF
ncbi:hypothetical protein Q4610_04420 [Sphingobium sp. HBC34]|uniref:Lipoprotein n=1 Tax=Sphingobium cyanobacteriorum TaxID=3063954 RepID=A0ABT8ZIC9_9SPHN|nr:hypothetical protein [Sphingobium sp. HBC34]MDO7834283.1 hypothetical protein [Sphingobium sp. HBC34]